MNVNKEVTQSFVRIKAIVIDTVSMAYFFTVLNHVLLNFSKNKRYFYEFSWHSHSLGWLCGIIFGLLWFFSRHSLGYKLCGLINTETSSCWQALRILFVWSLILATFSTGLILTQFSFNDLFDRQGIKGAGRIFLAMLHPKWSIFNGVLIAIVETVYIALISTILAIPTAFVLSFLAAKNIMGKGRLKHLIYMGIRIFINFFRSIEPLIWAIVFSVWVGIGPFAGMLALMVNSVVGLIKLYSEQIENIDSELVLAIKNTGASSVHVMWFGVVPQIISPFLALTIYRWDLNVRMATVIGLVGGGGVGTLLMQYQGLAKWNEVGLIVMMIALVVCIMDYFSARIREII